MGAATLDEVIIRASPFNVSVESTATKSDLPAAASPFSVDLVPRHLFDDRGALDMEEVLQNVGAHGTDTSGWGAKSFFLRGFQVDNFYVDGIKQASYAQVDPALIQQIDVLRGAAGSLYGRIDPGGVINVVTVSPQATRSVTAEQSFGSYGLSRTVIDATGPLDDAHRFLYRLTSAYQSNDSHRDFITNRHFTLAPSLSFIASDHDRIDLKLLYQDFRDSNDSGVPLVPVTVTDAGKVTSWRFLPGSEHLHIGPVGSGYRGKTTSVTLTAKHEFNDRWSLKPTIGWYRLNQPGSEGGFTEDIAQPNGDYTGWHDQPAGGWGSDNPRYIDIYAGNPSNFFQEQSFAELDLNGRFSTGPVEHRLLLSAEYFSHRYSYQVWMSSTPALPIDITHPVYQSIDLFSSPADPSQIAFGSSTKDHWTSFTLQDQLSFRNRFRIVAGLRYDQSNTSLASPTGDCAGWYCGYRDSKLTPRLGINVDITPALAAYASYSQGYGVNDFWQLYDGSLSKSQTSRQIEAGLKGHWFGDWLVARLTAFDLAKRNIVVSVPIYQFPGGTCVAPDYTGQACFEQVGTFGSRGVELDLEGKLTDRLSINAYMESLHAKVVDGGNPIGAVAYTVGQPLRDVAPRSGSLWLQYKGPGGLGLGGGVTGMSSRPFNAEGTFTLPGYLEADVAASYEWKQYGLKWHAQLNLKNLTGEHTYDLNWSGDSVIPGAPRTVLLSIGAKWN
jgi:iron complex outermembrane receptor protein